MPAKDVTLLQSRALDTNAQIARYLTCVKIVKKKCSTITQCLKLKKLSLKNRNRIVNSEKENAGNGSLEGTLLLPEANRKKIMLTVMVSGMDTESMKI